MAKRLYEENNIQDLANAIREKNGSTDKYRVDQMAGKVRELEARKPEQEKTLDVVSVGTTEVLPDEGKVLNKVTINVNVAGAPPSNALFSFTDYNDLGYPTTLIYNCNSDTTADYLFCVNYNYGGQILQYIKKAEIPDTVTKIGNGSFQGNSSLEELTNWDSITYIADSAFALNGKYIGTNAMLQHDHFPPNLTYIGKNAFRKNLNKMSQDIPDSVTYIGDNAFAYGGKSSWKITKLPSNVTYIGASAFQCYRQLLITEIPEAVETIGALAFNSTYDKTSLTLIKFRGTPISIDGTAFNNNTSLVNIYVPWAEGAVANAPWGATNATIHYNTTYDADGNPVV